MSALRRCPSTPTLTGASWRDEQDRVENRSASAAVIALALVRTVFATLTLSLKWQINVISALSPDWQKAFRPFAGGVSPGTRTDLGREDSPEIQAWLQQNKYYQYQLLVPGNRIWYRRFGQHLIKKKMYEPVAIC